MIRLSRRGHYRFDRGLDHLGAVVPFSFQERFPLASLAGRRALLYARNFGKGHPWLKCSPGPFLARWLGAPAFYISGFRSPLLPVA